MTADFDAVLDGVRAIAAGPFRRDCLAAMTRGRDGRGALQALDAAMRSHRWTAGGRTVALAGAVRELDTRTRADGFHALHDWDGLAGRFNRDTIPAELVPLAIDRRGEGAADPAVLAVLLEYYLVYLLALGSLRVWDMPDPDAAFDRLGGVLASVQGPGGSGQAFARQASTLFLVATSHYEADDRAFARLLERTRTLDRRHQVPLAAGHAASLGCHLRFGFEATYGRNLGAMREDNAADYPWLSWALAVTLAEYDRVADDGPEARADLADAILNGLSPDPAAFLGDARARGPIDDHERHRIRGLIAGRRDLLRADAARRRPADGVYSPLAFFFNFCQNVLKGAVLDAVLWGEPSPVALDDLFVSRSLGEAGDAARLGVVRTLMAYARENPHRIRGDLMPVIVYDPHAGRRACGAVVRALA